jgi:TP901 family phage tail tape measure protein
MQNEKATSSVFLNGEQAKNELNILGKKAKELRDAIRQANEAGDEKAFAKYNKELKATEKQMNQLQKESFDVKKVLDNLSGSSIKDLEKAQRQLNAQLRSGDIARNSEEWHRLTGELKSVRTEISNIQSETRAQQSGISKLADGLNKYFAMFTAGFAAVTGFTLALKDFYDQKNKLEDSKANLKALTGLGDNDVDWLAQEAKKLSTEMTSSGVRIRASSQEIVDAFTLVGSAKPELLKNKEALKEVTEQSMILAEASKMDLKDAVKGITIALNMYGASASEAARYTNVLGAGAKEGAAEVSSQTESILKAGVAASQAGIPIEQLVGSIQALAEKGIKDEIAGTGLKTFFIKLQSGADDTNPKIVGLQKALENLAAKNLSTTEIQKQFGLETYSVATTMISSAQKVDFYTKAVTGTNIALEQAQINSKTTAARLAQAKNNFNELGMQLVEGLNPAMLKAADLGNVFLRFLIQLPKWISENKGLLFTLAITMGTYAVAVNQAWIASVAQLAIEKLKVFWTNATTAATLAQTAVVGYLTGNIKAANVATKAFFSTLGVNPFIAIGVAIAAVTIGLYNWISGTQKAMTLQSESAKVSAEASAKMDDEMRHLEFLKGVLNDSTKGYTERNNALIELKKIVPEYHAQLTQEGKLINDNKEALDKYINTLKLSTELQIATTNRGNLVEERRKFIQEYKSDLQDLVMYKVKAGDLMQKGLYNNFDEALSAAGAGAGLMGLDDKLKKMNSDIKVYDDLIEDLGTKKLKLESNLNTNTTSGTGTGTPTPEEKLKKELDALDKWKLQLSNYWKEKRINEEDGVVSEEVLGHKLNNVQLEYFQRKKRLYKDGSAEQLEIQAQIDDILLARQKESLKDEEEQAKNNLKLFKESHQAQLNLVDANDAMMRRKLEMDLEDKVVTQSEYDQSILELDYATADKRLKIANNYAEDAADYNYASEEDRVNTIKEANAQALESDKAYRKARANLVRDGWADIKEIEQRYGLNTYNAKRDQYKKDLKLLQDKLEKEKQDTTKSSEDRKKAVERIEKDITKVRLTHAEETAQSISEIASKAGDFSSKLQEAETLHIENKYAAQLKAAKGNSEKTAEIEAKMEEEKKEMKKQYADIDFGITSAKIIASTSLAAMKAWELGYPMGPIMAGVAVAAGFAELAVANEQRESVKNLWTGGFTDPGNKYEPDGIVHKGEFVANQDAVGNPVMRRVFNLVDYAQKTNTVASLTSDDVARSIGMKNGLANGGWVSKAPMMSVGNGISKEELSFAIESATAKTNAVTQALLDRLNQGISAEVSITGKNGIDENMKTYNKLIKNAQR